MGDEYARCEHGEKIGDDCGECSREAAWAHCRRLLRERDHYRLTLEQLATYPNQSPSQLKRICEAALKGPESE